eukprot:UN3008
MKVFTIFYIFLGLFIVARRIDEAVWRGVMYYEEKVKQFNRQLTHLATDRRTGSMIGSTFTRSITQMKSQVVNMFPRFVSREALMKVSMTSALLLSPLVVGTVVVALNEDWPWLHGFYWSVVTCTTVGYGGLRLEKQSTRVFATVFVLGGFALVGAALGNIGVMS